MSYLDAPRLHFAGRFQADVSTVNNDPEHFDDGRFIASYQEPQTASNLDGWWNPTGSGAWRLKGCTIVRVDDADANTPPGTDPILGASITANDASVPAKLVDLDPEQQMVSTIFGMHLTVRAPDGSAIVAGEFQAAPFENIWVRFPAGQPDSFFSATYSRRSPISSGPIRSTATRSPLCAPARRAVRSRSASPSTASIRMRAARRSHGDGSSARSVRT